jgi:hypothetical protein
MGLVLLVYVPKLILTLVLLGDLFRLGAGSINYFIENDDNTAFSSRRKFVNQVGLVSCNHLCL